MVLISVVIALFVAFMLFRVLRTNRKAQDPGGRQTKTPPAPAQRPAPRAEAPSAPAARAPAAPADLVRAGGTRVDAAGSAAPVGADAAAAAAWAEAARLRRSVLAREVPRTMAVWEIVPEQGEVFFYDLRAVYERYYGQDVSYTPSGGFFFGSPAFILAGMAVTGLANSSRRRAAEAQAQTQWREYEPARVIVSNHRILCLVRGQWLSFSYGAMTAVYPEVAQATLVCEFRGAPPLRLRGADVPIAAVMTVFATHGLEAVAEHPSLQVLGAVAG